MAALVAASAQTVGPSVVAGQAQILTAGDTTVVTQSTSKAIINWQSFSVASGSTVQFAQPGASAITLNRVTGGAASSINGALLANGQVWILNSNGVLFGQGASIHVGGLLATTSDIADNDFVSGNYRFTTGGSGSIVNNGTIKAARGGSVVLSAPTVINNGLVQATAGHVVLAGTDTFTVDFSGDHLLSYAVGASSQTGTVMNSGIIKAAGGQVLLTARAAAGVADGVINNTGMVEATSVRKGETGEIILDAGDGAAETSGTLDASGKVAGATGGSVQVLGQTVAVTDGARIDVSGDAGGGTALIGGNFKGAGPQANAQTTTVGKAIINANAVTSGNGGKVAVYSTGTTSVTASISAKGSAGGAGGDVETSGHFLSFDGITVNAGPGGNWLLDPYDLTVDAAAATSISSTLNGGTNSTLQTTATGASGYGNANASGNGDIFINAPISWSSSASLTIQAYRNVQFNANVSITGSGTLSINTGQGMPGDYYFATGASVNYSGGGALDINGNGYILLYSMTNIQALNSGSLTGYYALATSLDATSVSGWTPIGDNSDGSTLNSGAGFAGTFEGLGNTISNLTINNAAQNNQAFFGYASNGTIRDLGLRGGSVTGGTNVGGLVGWANGSEIITNDYATGNVIGSADNVGGLVGQHSGTISNSYATGNVSASGGQYNIGGLVGESSGTISLSYASGNVTAGAGNDGLGGYNEVGGLLGQNYGGTVTKSYATGSVTGGTGTVHVGGLIGWNNGAISNSYAMGAVSSGANAQGIGGLLGLAVSGGSISNSYSTGAVTGGAGASALGGFIGQNLGGSTITGNYWNTQTSGLSTDGSGSGATGMTTAQLQGTLPAGFGGAWATAAGLYPYLVAMFPTAPQVVSGIAYSDRAITPLASTNAGAATVSVLANGVSLGSATTGANGYYYLTAPAGTIPASNGQVLAYVTAGGTGNSLSDGANGSVSNLPIYGNTVLLSTPIGAPLSNMINDLATARGMATGPAFLYTAPLTLNSGVNFEIDSIGGVTVDAALNTQGGSIVLDANTTNLGGAINITSAVSTNGGALTIGGTSNPVAGPAIGTATQNNGINISAALSSGGGAITINGTGSSMGGAGVNIAQAVSAGGGNIAIKGTGGAATSNNNTGIVVHNTITNSGTGAITLNGTGGGASTSASNIGVQILAAITGSGGGAISITGTGGNTSGSYNAGIYQTAALVNYQSGVGGNITLNGTGGGTGSNEIGYFTSANVTAGNASASVNGNISITGAGSAAAAGSFNYGIQIQSASTIYTAGTGTITLAGTASGGTGGGIFGVFLNAGAIAAVNGLISVTGTSNAYSSATMDNGVQIAGTITSSGTGGVTVNGTGGGTGGAGADYGVYLAIANAIQTPGNAAVSLTGSGGDIGGLGTLNAGVYIGGALNVGRNISITGTGGAQGGAINAGIALPYGITSGGGTITLNSTGTVTGNGALSASGLELLGTGGTYLLTSTSSVVGTLSGNTGSVTYTQAGPLNIGPAGSTNGLTTTGAITLTAAGYVTQSFGIAATDLTITTTGSGSTISLNDLGGGADNGNQISGTARFNSASNVTYNSSYSSGPTVIGNSLINGNLTVNAGSHAVGINDASGSLSVTGNTVLFGGSFSQTIPIATQNLTVTAGNGNITLTGGNQVTGIVEMFANSAGANGTFTNSISTLLGNSSIGNSLTVMSGGTLTLQDSSPTGISASAVSLQAASGISQSTTSPNIAAGSLSALSAGGSVTLASTNNAISGTVTLGSAPTGSIAFTNSVATTLGAVSGLGATYSPVAGGSVTITSPNGGITLTGLVQMSGATQLISSSGGITESVTGQIISGSLSVQSAGTAGISLAQPFNIVTGSVSLIGPIGSANVSFANSVSTSLSSSSAGGTLTVTSAGNLTLLPSTILASQAGSGNTGVVLSATGAFINNSGSSALYLPNGARFLIYSQNPGGDAFGGLNSSNTAVWGTFYPTPVSASGSRYVFAFQPVITVAAGNLSKTYGVDVTASLVGDYTISGVQAGVANAFLGDTAAAIYGGTISLASAGAAAGAGVTAAPYFIQINAANFHVGGGYGLAVTGGATLTVNPATLTYNAAAGSRAYGAANPAYSGTVTGFVNGDTQASATTGTLAFTSPTTTASSVGSYAINGAGLSANNYTFVQAAGNAMALTINPATLTYAATATSRLYGQANAAFGGLVNGFVNGDTQASATSGSLAFTSAATAASDVGSYAINGSGLIASKNYVLVQAASNATALTINPATLTLALTGTVSKIFDGTTTATLSASNYAALSGIFGTDSVALSSDPTTGVYDTAAIGTGKTVTVSGIALSGAKAADYIIAGSVSGAVGVITAPATMTATTATATPAASASTFDTLFNATSVSGVPILAGFTTALITSTTPVSTPQQPPPTGPQVTIPITVVSLSTALGDMPSQDGNQPSDAPLSSDQTTSYVAQSLDGGPPPNRNGSHGADGAVIPHFLTARAARPVAPFNPRDLPSWGNAVLWN